MKIGISIGILALTLLAQLSVKGQTSQCKAADETAIRGVLAEFNDAWSAKSAVRYAAVFAEEGDWENAFGGRRKGRKEIEEFISGLVSQFSTATETITNTRVWCISSKMALVDIYQTISGQKLPSGNIVPTRSIRMTQLYEKTGGRWLIKVHRVADLRQMAGRPAAVESKKP